MKYFIVTKELAKEIGVDGYRQGCDKGYVCVSGDLCGIDVKAAIEEGSVQIVTSAGTEQFLRDMCNNTFPKEANNGSAEENTDTSDSTTGTTTTEDTSSDTESSSVTDETTADESASTSTSESETTTDAGTTEEAAESETAGSETDKTE